MGLINRIVHSSYQSIEKVGSSRIYSGLNNDVSAMSRIPGMVIGVASNFLTMVFCLSYLLSNSVAAFIASLSVILLNAFISFVTSRIASKYWEKNRDIQDIYFSQMSDLVYGFKELLLSACRRFAFWKDIKKIFPFVDGAFERGVGQIFKFRYLQFADVQHDFRRGCFCFPVDYHRDQRK